MKPDLGFFPVTPITIKWTFPFFSIALADFAVGIGEGRGVLVGFGVGSLIGVVVIVVGKAVGNGVIVGRGVGRGDGW